MVSEEKVESGFRNVGGDRFNRSSSSSMVSGGGGVFRISGEKGRFGFRNAGSERSRSSLKLTGFSVRACVFCLRSFLNSFNISGYFFSQSSKMFYIFLFFGKCVIFRLVSSLLHP